MTDTKKKAAARKEYNRRLAAGECINLSSIASKTGVNRCTLKGWIEKENWGDAPKLKRGAPAGNNNAKGNHGGAPRGNANSLKHGGYSKLLFEEFAADKLQYLDDDIDLEALLMDEIKLLTLRESILLARIAALTDNMV